MRCVTSWSSKPCRPARWRAWQRASSLKASPLAFRRCSTECVNGKKSWILSTVRSTRGLPSVITKVTEERARRLLACLKFMIGLERVGDLLLNCSNRAAAVGSRIDLQDIRDLTLMASRLEKMLGDVHDAFLQRDLNRALAVLRADAEMDRLRNLVFIRHLESHDNTPRAESFHVLFMTQSLERAGDHAKNLAEEVCHLVSGHTVRHVLRSYDKPVEQMFIDDLKRKQNTR